MRSIVLLSLMALVCDVCCRDLRGENSPRFFRLGLPKDKRGLSDHPPTFPSHGPISYAAPVHSGLSSGYSFGASSGGFPLGLHGLGGSVGHGIGYSLAPSPHLTSGYFSSGQSHGSFGPQGLSLGGHAAQSTYSVPNVISLAGGNNGLFIPSKTGPVTFGLHGGSGAASTSNSHSAPIYTSGSHRLSSYNSGGSGISFPMMLTSSPLGTSSGSSYSLPIHSSGSSHPVTGGLVIASGSPGSSSYSLPVSGSAHGIAALSGSSGSHGASHGASSASYAGSSSSGSYGSSGSHTGLSSALTDSSSYEVPASSGSYSGSSANYLSSNSNSGSSYSSGGSASYESPAVTYATPSPNYADTSSSGYSGAASGYSALSSSYSNPRSSYSSPIVSYAGSSSYTPTYSSPSSSYGRPAESRESYSSVNPRYLRYVVPKAYDDSEDSESIKYDTISYSSPDGKYSVA